MIRLTISLFKCAGRNACGCCRRALPYTCRWNHYIHQVNVNCIWRPVNLRPPQTLICCTVPYISTFSTAIYTESISVSRRVYPVLLDGGQSLWIPAYWLHQVESTRGHLPQSCTPAEHPHTSGSMSTSFGPSRRCTLPSWLCSEQIFREDLITNHGRGGCHSPRVKLEGYGQLQDCCGS